MSGRGRGRGGMKPASGGLLLLQQAAGSRGQDLRMLKDGLMNSTELYPEFLQSSKDVSTTSVGYKKKYPLVECWREISHRIQSSGFYIRPNSTEMPDVIRRAQRPGAIAYQRISYLLRKVKVV